MASVDVLHDRGFSNPGVGPGQPGIEGFNKRLSSALGRRMIKEGCMSIPFVYNELLEACRSPGCPVCRLSQRAVRRYLVNLFYENVNDGNLRAQLRKSLGFL
jgi:hypothetical protein